MVACTGLELVPEDRNRATDRTVAQRCDFYVAVQKLVPGRIAIGDGPDDSVTLCFMSRLKDLDNISVVARSTKQALASERACSICCLIYSTDVKPSTMYEYG